MEKCEVIHFCGKENGTAGYYEMARDRDTGAERDLDVFIRISEMLHADSAAIRKVNGMLAFIAGRFEEQEMRCMAAIIRGLVRPHLEYVNSSLSLSLSP